jgi:RNA polymerase-interacting CarD/CdnL/TRCF family regulator
MVRQRQSFIGRAFFVLFSTSLNQEAIMDYKIGDTVVHCMYGLGRVIRLEEQTFSGEKMLYYVVQVRDMTVWVPANAQVMSRLRTPTPRGEFPKLFSILNEPGGTLPVDRLERRTHLLEELNDGKAESCCRVVRDLSFLQHIKPLNDNDRLILKQASDTLLGEWEFSLSVPLALAQARLHDLLIKPSHSPASV